MRDITLTISTDAQGFSKNATLIIDRDHRATNSNTKVHLSTISKSLLFIKFGAKHMAYE